MTNDPSPVPSRNLPVVAYVCITVVVLAFVASITYLTAAGADTTEVRQTFNTLANFGGLLFGGVAAVGGTVAARNAQQAAHQTNGGLDARIEAGVQRALNARTGGSLGTEP